MSENLKRPGLICMSDSTPYLLPAKHFTQRCAVFFIVLTLLAGCGSSRKIVRRESVSLDNLPGKGNGVASWYGPDFHGRPTASGEKFDMYASTCAHRQYPFGTRLKVTNVNNNKSVECIVNDRGPFIEGRDIDLSYAAAKEIGMIGTGTARIMLEVQGRDTSYIKTVSVQPESRKSGPFAIQVGSFTESVNAVRLKVALRLKYVNAYIQETEVKGTTYYRVRVGNFEQFSSVMEIARQLGEEGYPALVVKADIRF